MKRRKIFGAMMMLVFCVISVPAQNKANPQTVTDYFMLMPKEYLSMLDYSKKPRKALIQVQDVKNGYMSLSTEESEEGAQIALFRKTNREAVIAVAQTACSPACGGSLIFVQYKNGKWSNITKQVMPEFGDRLVLAAYNRIKKGDDETHTLEDMPYTFYELPQTGTTIELRNGDAGGESSGKALLRFEWNGERFTLARAGR